MLKREIGDVKLVNLSAMVLRDFIDGRIKVGAGGVTIAADLSTFSSVLNRAARLHDAAAGKSSSRPQRARLAVARARKPRGPQRLDGGRNYSSSRLRG